MSLIVQSEFRSHRKLGAMETTMALMHECAYGSTQGVISVCMASTLDADIFHAAVRHVFGCFEILRCIIRENEQGLYFAEEAHIDKSYSEPIHTRNQHEWNYIEEKLAHIPLSPNACLWAAHIVYNPDMTLTKILLVSHHAIFDAQGATIVLNTLLEYLDTTGEVNAIDQPISASLDDFLMSRSAACVPGLSNARPNQVPYTQNTGIAFRRTCYHRVQINSNSANLLRTYAFANSVNEQSLISAAFVKAIFQVGLEFTELDLRTAVALRDFAIEKGLAVNSVGCYLGIAAINIHSGDLNLMEIARDIQAKNIEYIMDNCLFQSDVDVSTIRERITRLVGSAYFSGFAVTNVGKLPVKKFCQGIPIEGIKIFTNRVIGNYALTLQILELESFTAFDFIYVSNLIDASTVRKIASRFQDNLYSLTTNFNTADQEL